MEDSLPNKLPAVTPRRCPGRPSRGSSVPATGWRIYTLPAPVPEQGGNHGPGVGSSQPPFWPRISANSPPTLVQRITTARGGCPTLMRVALTGSDEPWVLGKGPGFPLPRSKRNGAASGQRAGPRGIGPNPPPTACSTPRPGQPPASGGAHRTPTWAPGAVSISSGGRGAGPAFKVGQARGLDRKLVSLGPGTGGGGGAGRMASPALASASAVEGLQGTLGLAQPHRLTRRALAARFSRKLPAAMPASAISNHCLSTCSLVFTQHGRQTQPDHRSGPRAAQSLKTALPRLISGSTHPAFPRNISSWGQRSCPGVESFDVDDLQEVVNPQTRRSSGRESRPPRPEGSCAGGGPAVPWNGGTGLEAVPPEPTAGPDPGGDPRTGVAETPAAWGPISRRGSARLVEALQQVGSSTKVLHSPVNPTCGPPSHGSQRTWPCRLSMTSSPSMKGSGEAEPLAAKAPS